MIEIIVFVFIIIATLLIIAYNVYVDKNIPTPVEVDKNIPIPVYVGYKLEHSGKALNINKETGEATQWDFDNSGNQKWFYNPVSQEMQVEYSKQCLSTLGNTTNNHTKIGQMPCVGGNNQKWIFQDDKTLKNPISDRCIHIPGGENGSKLILWDCDTPSARNNKFSPI